MLNLPLPPLESLSFSLPQVWDSTMIVAARRCPRYFLYAYANHVRGGGLAPPLLFGGAFAKGLETYRQAYFAYGRKKDIALEAGAEEIFTFWGDNPPIIFDKYGEGDKRTLDKCIWALMQYFERWPIDTDSLQPHMSEDGKPTFEFSFSVPLEAPIYPRMADGSPFFICGRMDTLGMYDALPIWSDEKTTIRMGSKWAEQWYTRHQFMTYGSALRMLGFKARHVLVRGIGIRKDGVEFAETTPIHRPDHLLDKFEHELAWTLRQMQAYFEAQAVPRNFGDGCFAYFRQCDFWEVCSTKPDYELPFLKRLPRNQWNPLQLAMGEED